MNTKILNFSMNTTNRALKVDMFAEDLKLKKILIGFFMVNKL